MNNDVKNNTENIADNNTDNIALNNTEIHYIKPSRFPWLTDSVLIHLARKGRRGFVLPVEILIFFAVFIIVQIVPGMIGSVLAILLLAATGAYENFDAISEALYNGPMYLIVNLFVIAASIGACFIYCLLIEKRPVQSMGFRGKKFFLHYLKGLAIGFILFASVVIIGVIFGGFRFVGIVDFAPAMLLAYFVFFLIQGMEEEILCRGYFMISLSRRTPMWAAVLTNSLVFAALHLLNPGIGVLPIINLTLFGLFASLYMLRTGNIWGVGALHSIWNFAQGNIFGLPVSGLFTDEATFFDFEQTGSTLINGGAFGPEGGLPVTVVYAIAIALVLFFPSKRLTNEL